MYEDLLSQLKAVISVSDLRQYLNNEDLLRYAIEWAISEINSRRNHIPTEEVPFEPRYRNNVVQGATDWLSRIGGEEYQSSSDNGVSVSFKAIPSWLLSVTPKLGV